jgi:hypothetical protein
MLLSGKGYALDISSLKRICSDISSLKRICSGYALDILFEEDMLRTYPL